MFYITLETDAKYCNVLQNIAEYSTHITQFCTILQIKINYCKILQDIAEHS